MSITLLTEVTARLYYEDERSEFVTYVNAYDFRDQDRKERKFLEERFGKDYDESLLNKFRILAEVEE